MDKSVQQTGIQNAQFGDHAQIEINQNINQTISGSPPPPPRRINPHNLRPRGVEANQFIGREAVLAQLHGQLEGGEQVAISTVTGMGGIGKTELALQYAWQQWQQEHYKGGVCWCAVADNGEPGTALTQFAYSYLGLAIPEDQLTSLPARVQWCWQHWPRHDPPTAASSSDTAPPTAEATVNPVLVVFDDVRHYEQVRALLPPQGDARFKVIITTRNETIARNFTALNLEVLTPEAARQLLAVFLPAACAQDPDTAAALVRWLGFLPLGIELVGRYGQYMKLDVATLLAELQAQPMGDAVGLQRSEEVAMTADRGIAAAFTLSWQELSPSSQLAGQLLSLFAEAPIPEAVALAVFAQDLSEPSVWQRWFPTFSQPFLPKPVHPTRDDLRHLVNLNLLQDVGQQQYQLHALLRSYCREKLEASAVAEAAKRLFCRLLVEKAQQVPQTVTLSDIATFDPLLPHWAIVATTLSPWLGNKNLLWPFEAQASLYQGQCLFTEAENWYRASVDLCKAQLGDRHPSTATSTNNLAGLYRSMGRYEEALPLHELALDIRKEQLGERHPSTATSYNNLALLYRSMGRYEEALPLYELALEIRKEQLGDRHPSTATSYNKLAQLYYSMGRYEEALPLYELALDIRKEQLGERHPSTASSYNNLALLYYSMGRYEAMKKPSPSINWHWTFSKKSN